MVELVEVDGTADQVQYQIALGMMIVVEVEVQALSGLHLQHQAFQADIVYLRHIIYQVLQHMQEILLLQVHQVEQRQDIREMGMQR